MWLVFGGRRIIAQALRTSHAKAGVVPILEQGLTGHVIGNIIQPVNKPVFDVHYGDQRTALVMEADLDRGWGKLQKTYGFFRWTWVPYRGDLKIRAQMSVIAQPGGFEAWSQEFPPLGFEESFHNWSVSVHARQLVLKVPLSPDQIWRKTEQGRPEIFIEHLHLLDVDMAHWFDLRVWIVFHEGSSRQVPDVRLWAENNLIVSGGQVESKRSRH